MLMLAWNDPCAMPVQLKSNVDGVGSKTRSFAIEEILLAGDVEFKSSLICSDSEDSWDL